MGQFTPRCRWLTLRSKRSAWAVDSIAPAYGGEKRRETPMTAIAVQRYNERQARARRANIIRSVGDETDFRNRASHYLLTATEQSLFNELEDLDYLLSL
jgi:hypothetical protein